MKADRVYLIISTLCSQGKGLVLFHFLVGTRRMHVNTHFLFSIRTNIFIKNPNWFFEEKKTPCISISVQIFAI